MVEESKNTVPLENKKLLETYVAVPLSRALMEPKKYFQDVSVGNKHEQFRRMLEVDSDLRSAITQIAIVCASAFKGVTITGEGEVGESEKLVLQEARDFYDAMHSKTYFDVAPASQTIRDLAFQISHDVMTHGDSVLHLATEAGIGVTEITPLPNERLTQVETQAEIGTIDALKIYSKSNFYVVDEAAKLGKSTLGGEPKPYPKEQIVHIDWNRRNAITQDIVDRWTQGLWSVSPLESLKLLMMWKINTIHNDLLWRHRMVPRYHHALDLSAFDPNFYTGSRSEQIAAAKKDAEAAIADYNTRIAEGDVQNPLQADQGFTTGKEVEIKVIEPKSTSYASPNEILDQIIESTYNAVGVPPPTMRSFAAIYMASEFLVMRGQFLAERIASKLNWIIHRHLALKGRDKEIIKRIRLIVNFTLERNMVEKARMVAILETSKKFTSAELRTLFGLAPLTDLDIEDLKKMAGIQAIVQGKVGHPFGTDTPDELTEKAVHQPDQGISPYPKYPSEVEADRESRGGEDQVKGRIRR